MVMNVTTVIGPFLFATRPFPYQRKRMIRTKGMAKVWRWFVGLLAALFLIGAAAQTLPPAMLGTWGWEAASCARADDDGRLTVKARSLDFYASSFKLQTVAVQPDGSVGANATYSEEGEEKSSRAEVRLKLVASGSLLVQTGTLDDGHVYVRCNP